ncbi:TPA: hypothetical protein ORM06_004043 [Klebsiella aerogenes]|nr:hypothetical protein [Klebsiella aerogenes]HBW5539003.1 hypothetical protein [Klebsiella aerogenes]HCS4222083.1 hypothetical protein [Klebsiella aerogenes]
MKRPPFFFAFFFTFP